MSQGGRYERIRAIASGGMATVYLGRATGVGGFERLVAIKVMHSHLASDPEFVKMFFDEARVAASIRHPNVVSVLDLLADDQGVSLVMDYIEGPSLSQLAKAHLENNSTFRPDVAVRIILDTLSGLQAAHELEGPGGVSLGIVHRDVSPHNVLIGIDGSARITDFGVAFAQQRLQQTQSGQMKGKLSYMAPEQMLGEQVDRRADIYSVGVILWELLSGERLFAGENEGALAVAALGGVEKSPRQINPNVPAILDDVVMCALKHEARERFGTAASFAESLEQAAREAGVGVATNRQVTDVVHAYEEDRPTRMRPDAARVWLQQLGIEPPKPSEFPSPSRTPHGTLMMLEADAKAALQPAPAASARPVSDPHTDPLSTLDSGSPRAADATPPPAASAAAKPRPAPAEPAPRPPEPPAPHGEDLAPREQPATATGTKGNLVLPARSSRAKRPFGFLRLLGATLVIAAAGAGGWFSRPWIERQLQARGYGSVVGVETGQPAVGTISDDPTPPVEPTATPPSTSLPSPRETAPAPSASAVPSASATTNPSAAPP